MKCVFVVFAVVVIAIATSNNDIFGHFREASQKEGASTWVVLIAGGREWKNYRYQSSVCKAYQLVHKAGVPDDHIITLFADDIAYNSENPFPGQIYNELYEANGTNINVYEGVVKDYTGENATKQNLIDVLSGNSITSGSGKTLLSTEDDNVFIFYDGSGGPGFIGMPDDDLFLASDLTTVLSTMTSKRMFKNLVIFLSSSRSGSMIENQILPPNVYIVTSTSPSNNSYACMQDSELHTFVTSCFSHGWIHSIDIHGPNVDFGTIYDDTYNYVTTVSPTPPCEYGDLSIKSVTWSGFLKLNQSASSSSISSSMSSSMSANQKEGSSTWVVLIAGSNGWNSYRYQSSVCKAYQLVHKAGVPDDQIITLFADDIAYNSENPFPGQIYNELYEANGTNINVYEGVVKDYTGKNATKQNLIDVLSGNPTTSGSGKTLLSTEDDNVFIFYDGTGGSGMIGLPDDTRFLASDLTIILNTMTSKRMFKNLVIFLSAAYSGSMIEDQTLPPNVYIVTSTSPSANSFSCLQDPLLGTYVTSCFSHGWIQSIDTHGLNADFGTIYDDVCNYLTISGCTPPCEYGDLSVKSTALSAFLKLNQSVASSSILSSISSMNDHPVDMSLQISGAHSLSHITCYSDTVTSLLLLLLLFCYSYFI